MNHLMQTYAHGPSSLVAARGDGFYLWDAEGRRYLDLIAGVGVCGLGHAHPDIVAALTEQIATLIHCSNLYRIPEQEQAAERLAMLSGARRVFFCNSGCEANEAAIKLTLKYAHLKGVAQPRILVATGSFHGRTIGTMAATCNPKVREGFGELPSWFHFVPYNDVKALENAAEIMSGSVVAVMLEPLQGEGGVNQPDASYLASVRRLCDERGWLLLLDEVQCGVGRTGKWFAHQHSDIHPDVMTLAKGLGSGVPVGACLAWGRAAEVFQPGAHGSTFGGNPLAARAVLSTLDVMERDNLLGNARVVGDSMLEYLRRELSGVTGVLRISGAGLMLGIKLDRPCLELVEQGRNKGLLINVTNQTVVRLLPPLILSKDEALKAMAVLVELLKKFVSSSHSGAALD